MKIKNVLFLFGILILFGIVTAGAAEAVTYDTTGNPDDTLAGTVITAEAANNELNYTDINGNSKPPVFADVDIETVVLPTYGFNMALLPDYSMIVDQMVSNESGITNEGNASDSITMTFEASFADAGSGTWTIYIKKNPGAIQLTQLTPGSPSYTTTEVYAEDADIIFFHEVTTPTSAGTPGGVVVITTEATTANAPVGEYTGANGLTYGGQGATSETTYYTLYKPLMQLTRTSTVDAPNNYTGDDHDAVPGSVATYTLTYNNAGNTSAASVVIVDRIPTPEAALQANIAHFNANTTARTNVTIDAGQGSASGWDIYYSDDDNPTKSYVGSAGSGWLSVGTLTPNTVQFPGTDLYTNGSTEFTAKWVKWEKASVAAAENDSLTYGVTIR